MGYSLCWVAVRGKAPQAVRNELGLRDTGQREAFPESPFDGAELPGGWYIVVEDHGDQFVQADILARLSSGCEVVTCDVEEHVMVSGASGWKDGAKKWSIIHDAQKSIEHLEANGELPSDFSSVRDRLRAQQTAAGGRKAEVDYIFDVPVEVAKSLTGFQHDKDTPGLEGNAFEVLESTRPDSPEAPKKSLWRKMFG